MTENKTTIEKPHKRRKTTQKAPINTEMLNKQTAVKNWTKRRNRRTKQTQSRQPPDNNRKNI